MKLPIKLCVASLNYQKLDEKSLEALGSAKLQQGKDFIENFRLDLGFKVDELSVIDKCNAIIVVFSYHEDLLEDFVKGRLLTTWDKLSNKGITSFTRDIKFIYDDNAVKYLGECAAGIHSVTLGDSQVLSQVVDCLQQGIGEPGAKTTFSLLIGWIKDVIYDIKIKTNFLSGNTSLERIACEFIIEKFGNNKNITVLGYGKTGKLIVKILTSDYNLKINLANRSKISSSIEEEKIKLFELNNFKVIGESDLIVNTISNNEDTKIYFNELIKNISNINNKFFLDLSSPSLLKNKIENLYDIVNFSNIANNNIKNRLADMNKVKEIINKSVSKFLFAASEEYGKSFLKNQINLKINRVEKEKLKIVGIRSELYKTIRAYLEKDKFIEVTTPYIVGISTDPPKVDKGGTIDVKWQPGINAFLRQSNQIYKQILVASGMNKIYEIGPFWRSETSESYRHLQESIGLDVEIKEPKNLKELYLQACSIIIYSNKEIVNKFKIKSKVILPKAEEVPVLTYSEAVSILNENGSPVMYGEDLGLISEAKLGQIVKKKHGSDIFVIKDYPDTIKKFYTKKKSGGLTETFDIIVCGWELVSGAIRQTDGKEIKKSMMISGLNIDNYAFYISIVDGAVSHGGFCIGIDRLLAKILELEMISDAVVFPRTFKKLVP